MRQFAGNSSGQALKLKLLTMNLLAKNKMRPNGKRAEGAILAL